MRKLTFAALLASAMMFFACDAGKGGGSFNLSAEKNLLEFGYDDDI